MTILPEIFKAYDVRALYPSELNEPAAYLIGRAYVAYMETGRPAGSPPLRISVSRDMRLSSPSLSESFVNGARDQGANIIDFGLASTDMMYFSVAGEGFDGGVQITASHNPKGYNGLKMVRQDAIPLSGDEGIGDIRDMVVNDRIPASSRPRGTYETREMLDAYVERVMGFIDPAVIKPFNVVLDAGSGMAGLVAPKLFDRLPCKTTRLCFEVDGTFPNHEANPLIEENRRDIVERVIADKADIGIAWDGDADRCFLIDGAGEFIAGDFVTALLAESFLMKSPGETIVYDVRASYAVKDTVAKYNGKALMNRVGHAFIKNRMRNENGVFGGEVTGHYYFRDFYFADNGFIPALLILELMSRKGQTLAELLAPLRAKYFISGEINTKVASMDLINGRLKALADRYKDGHTYTIDGFSAEFPDWHFNVRASNTEPLLRLNLEGLTPQIMEQRRDEVLAIIRAS